MESSRGNRHGGTIINIVTAIIFFGLIGLGIWWLVKSFGQAGQQYTDEMVEAKFTAETVKCQTNLRAIGQNIRMYAISNGQFPASAEELAEWSGNSRLLRCPARGGAAYIYIPGQDPDMPATNVLVYEPNCVHDGRCGVLTLDGQLYLATEEELRIAVAQTLSVLGVDGR